MPRGETDLGVEGCREPAKQGNGRHCAPSDALDFVTRHTRALGKVCDGEAKGNADGLVNEYTPAAKRAEEPAGHRQDPGVVRKTGYLV